MSRVEKELASLAPWAWDPLVGKHAPGSAMMRDFTEVVADKTVTGNTDSYRFNPDGPHPHGADGTPAHAHVGGKRARSPRRRRRARAGDGAEGRGAVVARETKTRHANHRPRRVQAAHRDQTQIRPGCRARHRERTRVREGLRGEDSASRRLRREVRR